MIGNWDWNVVIGIANVLEFAAVVLPICGLCLCGALAAFPGLRNIRFTILPGRRHVDAAPVLPVRPPTISFA